MNELIECKTCKKSIACLAENCPACGAPNDWLHPDVAQFLSWRKTAVNSRHISFANTKTAVSGQTATYSPWWAWAVALVICVIGSLVMMLHSFIASLPAVFITFLILLLTKRCDHFRADVVNRQWSSSNDAYWQHVRSALKL